MKHKRLAALLSLLLAFLLLVPSRAYADARFGYVGLLDGVQCHNDYNDFENFLVFAPDKYAAAVMAVGGDVNSLTADQKLKLSDHNYGGAFYDYAQTFHDMQGTTFPDFVPTYIAAALLVYYSPIPNGLNYFAPDSEFYYSVVSPEIYTAAKAAYLAVINGEDTGSGGSAPDGYVLFRSGERNGNRLTLYNVRDSSQSPIIADISNVLGTIGEGTPYISGYTYQWDSKSFYCISVPSGVYSVRRLSDNKIFLYNSNSSSVTCPYFYSSNVWPSGNVYTLKNTSQNRFSIAAGAFRNLSDDNHFNGPWIFSVFGAPPAAGDWPEDEPIVTPTAPVVPEPDDETPISEPVVVPPSVTFPDIDITITDNSPEGTTPEDYTPWLRAINENLNSLRSDLLVEFDALKTSIRNIYTYLQHLDDLLENHCVHLRNQIITSTNHIESYLQGLFTWLGEQLSFSFDDTNIVIWLKRIYSRLGGSNTFQPDPISDDDGFLDWLYQLWQNFLIDLLSVLPDSLGGLVETISQLTHYFPFSIPWDLAALLALFEHEPVIPVFDIPFPYSADEGGQVMLHIDLTDWDPVAQMVRPVFVVGFCMQLAFITKDLLSSLDMSKGGI